MGKDRLYKRGITIDNRNRVTLPSELLEELKLKEGDKVAIYADFDNCKIIVRLDVKTR